MSTLPLPLTSSSSSLSTATTSTPPTSQNIRVITRIRPLSTHEKSTGCCSVLQTSSSSSSPPLSSASQPSNASTPNEITLTTDPTKTSHTYDSVYGENSSNLQIYKNVAQPLIREKLFKGFNATIVAYGQTGSGKTYTMGTNFEACSGEEDDDENGNEDEGIIPRSIKEIFKLADAYDGDVVVVVSYLEIYNEEIYDLLLPSSETTATTNTTNTNSTNSPKLQVHQSLDGTITVPNLTHVTVKNVYEVCGIMISAGARRKTGETKMNKGSSRSHAICTLYLTCIPNSSTAAGGDGDGNTNENTNTNAQNANQTDQIISKYTLVDLAGSERAKRTGAEGDRLKEGININMGLFVLGQVISTLAEKGAAGDGEGGSLHVPYRDSKLTRLLTSSLGGNSHTYMIACVSPADIDTDESSNTLRYASRARSIKNSAVKNVVCSAVISAKEAVELRRENQALKVKVLQLQLVVSQVQSDSVCANVSTRSGGGREGDYEAQEQGNSVNNVVNLDRLEIVMKLRSENMSLKTKIKLTQNEMRKNNEEMLDASLSADQWRYKYEKICEIAGISGVSLNGDSNKEGGGGDDNLSAHQTKLIHALKGELSDARVDAVIARSIASAVVMSDGNLSAAEELAITDNSDDNGNDADGNNSNDEDEEDEVSRNTHNKTTQELTSLSSMITQKEQMSNQLMKERDIMNTLKAEFVGTMKEYEMQVKVLNDERIVLTSKLQSKDNSGSSGSGSKAGDSKSDVILKARLHELQEKIKQLNMKVNENAKSQRMREEIEKKCVLMTLEIENDKKRKVELQKRMRDEIEGRRSEKKASEILARRLLREGERLKVELCSVREAAGRQASVLKRKAGEAIARQKVEAEKRRRQVNGKASSSSSSASAGAESASAASLDKTRLGSIKHWIDREIETMSMVYTTKSQLSNQAKLRAVAAQKRTDMVGGGGGVFTKGSGSGNDGSLKRGGSLIKVLDMEIETRTGVIVQLQRSLMELERECRSNISGISQANDGGNGKTANTIGSKVKEVNTNDRFGSFQKSEMKYLLNQIFDNIVTVKRDYDSLKDKNNSTSTLQISEAVENERAIHRELTRKSKIEHSEAMMTLLEATKGAVEHKLSVQVMERAVDTGGFGIGINDELKDAVDKMLGNFMSGFDKAGNSLFFELESIKDEERKEKARVAAKVLKEKEKKKKKVAKIKGYVEEEEEEESEDEVFDEGDDSDWEEGEANVKVKRKREKERITGKANGKKKGQDDDDASLGDNDESEAGSDGESDFTNIKVKGLEKMKVADLKEQLKSRKLLVGGTKSVLIERLTADIEAKVGASSAAPATLALDSSSTSSSASLEDEISTTVASRGQIRLQPPTDNNIATEQTAPPPPHQSYAKTVLKSHTSTVTKWEDGSTFASLPQQSIANKKGSVGSVGSSVKSFGKPFSSSSSSAAGTGTVVNHKLNRDPFERQMSSTTTASSSSSSSLTIKTDLTRTNKRRDTTTTTDSSLASPTKRFRGIENKPPPAPASVNVVNRANAMGDVMNRLNSIEKTLVSSSSLSKGASAAIGGQRVTKTLQKSERDGKPTEVRKGMNTYR